MKTGDNVLIALDIMSIHRGESGIITEINGNYCTVEGIDADGDNFRATFTKSELKKIN
jgi:hypothetical protein